MNLIAAALDISHVRAREGQGDISEMFSSAKMIRRPNRWMVISECGLESWSQTSQDTFPSTLPTE